MKGIYYKKVEMSKIWEVSLSGPRVFWKAFFVSASSFFCTQIRTRFTFPVSNAFLAAVTTGPSNPSQWAEAFVGPQRTMIDRVIKVVSRIKEIFLFIISSPGLIPLDFPWLTQAAVKGQSNKGRSVIPVQTGIQSWVL